MRNQCSVFTQDAGACYRLHIAIVPSTTLPSPALSWARFPDMGANPYYGQPAFVFVQVRRKVHTDAHNQKLLHSLGHVFPACSSVGWPLWTALRTLACARRDICTLCMPSGECDAPALLAGCLGVDGHPPPARWRVEPLPSPRC